ncbi:MAG TPA: galactokinase [Spirochaetia bacterium]|nr:galactokinase [Spirochaetia bacterium]
MIITRTPFRITLGGGGTDLPSYYRKYGGFLLSAAVNGYMYILVNRRFEPTYQIKYSRTETVDTIDEIAHPIVREALRLVNIDRGIEIMSMADLPAESGLGSSGSFAVGLLNALHSYNGEWRSPQELAEEAFHIEAEILNEPVGKQDQYIAAYGGIISLEIGTDGVVKVTRHQFTTDVMDKLESNCIYFHTGIRRKSSEVLTHQSKSVTSEDQAVVEAMHQIKEIGRTCIEKFESGDVDWFGKSLDMHWQIKKTISQKMSDPRIDNWYSVALNNGALGGKLIGAGGGGFFMLYCPDSHDRTRLRKALGEQGLNEVRFRIESEGTKSIANIN